MVEAGSRTNKRGSGLRTLGIVFAVFGGLTLLGCLACGLSGYFWFEQNAAGMREMGERMEAEANTFASGHSQEECVEDGLRRGDLCQDLEIMCHAQASVFLRRCIDQANPTPGFCDGVPPPTAIMPSAQWALSYCASHGRSGDQQCPQLVRGVLEHCAAR